MKHTFELSGERSAWNGLLRAGVFLGVVASVVFLARLMSGRRKGVS